MSITVGVDGGQSQVRLRVSGSSEVFVATGVGHGDGDAVQLLADAVEEAWSSAGASQPIARLVLGLTTMPTDAPSRERLAESLAAVTGAREVWLTGDAVTSHAGAFRDHRGIVLAVGTGIACLAVDAETGRSQSVDGDGFLLGDNGASFWMGRRGLAAVLAAADGRGEPTNLSASATDLFGEHDDLAAHLHSLERPVDSIAQFATVVQRHAAAGDPISVGIVEDAATELLATVTAAAQIFTTAPVPLAVTGRAAGEGTALRQALERGLSDRPEIELGPPFGTSLDGACDFAATGSPGGYGHLIVQWKAP